MLGIGRRPMFADRGARGIGGVEAVVAVGAEAAERAKLERGEVSAMRFHVIGDGCRHNTAEFQTEPAQRLDHELMAASPSPAGRAVPPMNFRLVWHPPDLNQAPNPEWKRERHGRR